MSQEDYNELLNASVDLATDFLSQRSEFAPFALAMKSEDGEIFHVEPEDDSTDVDPEETIGALREGLREQLAKWRTVAVVADVTLEDDEGELVTAAIHVAMEHIAGDPVTCIVPYAIGEENVELADLVMEPGSRHVFPAAASA